MPDAHGRFKGISVPRDITKCPCGEKPATDCDCKPGLFTAEPAKPRSGYETDV